MAFGVLALSVLAVWVRVASYPDYVPSAVGKALDYFVEPGSAIWWLTIGKAFQAFPSDLPGYVVVSVANTAVWVVLILVGRLLVRASLKRL